MDDKTYTPNAFSEKAVTSPPPKVLKREVYEATREARDLIAQAQEKARQILEEAQRERDRIREEARREGQAQGLAEWNDILVRMRQHADEMAKNWEETMLHLSVEIARKIIGHELRQDPGTTLSIIREVLKSTRAGKRLTLQVNEAEVDYVRSQVQQLKQFLGGGEIEVVVSASVEPGGCIIDSELGIIDARLETQLKCLEEALVRHSPSE
jgi:type III secretion protein L